MDSPLAARDSDPEIDTIGLAPRRAALRILERVGRGLPMDSALEVGLKGLEDRDRRLAHELAAGVLRQQMLVDARLAPHVPHGLASVPPIVRGVLRLGAYQLSSLDRIPIHAAVSTSVDLARLVAGNKAAGFVNAVLRKVAVLVQKADGADRADKADDLSSVEVDSAALAALYSHPEWLVARWMNRFGPIETEALLLWNNTRPSLVVQPARAAQAELQTRFDVTATEYHAAPHGAGLIVAARTPLDLPGFLAGAFQVQDPAQALVVRFAGFSADAVVYDACAAPGGKTIALGRLVRRVIAGESRRSRVPRLVENLQRAGHGNEFVIAADASHPAVRPSSCLLDVPCLGTGTFARHPDARHKVSEASLERLVRRQSELLTMIAEVIPPGGLLVYSTCSLEPEENGEQIDGFLRSHPAFHREPAVDFPQELLSDAGDLTVLPQRHGVDGAYAARLRRAA